VFWVLSEGRWLASALGVDKSLRMKTFPIMLCAPWGISVGPLSLPSSSSSDAVPPSVASSAEPGASGEGHPGTSASTAMIPSVRIDIPSGIVVRPAAMVEPEVRRVRGWFRNAGACTCAATRTRGGSCVAAQGSDGERDGCGGAFEFDGRL
jgi:hypothetical protein